VSANNLPALQFNLSELAGSVGDFGTIIPLVLAVALVSDVNARYVLLFFGIWFILTGVYYRLPIPLEPMKAIAVIVIAGSITRGEIAAAGLILGIIFLVLGYGRFFGIIEHWVPQSVVRGIQLGLALLLFRSSQAFVEKDPTFFLLGVAIIACFYLLARFLEKEGKHKLRPKAIITTAEKVYDYQRDFLQKIVSNLKLYNKTLIISYTSDFKFMAENRHLEMGSHVFSCANTELL